MDKEKKSVGSWHQSLGTCSKLTVTSRTNMPNKSSSKLEEQSCTVLEDHDTNDQGNILQADAQHAAAATTA
jgi:hypothetical protein